MNKLIFLTLLVLVFTVTPKQLTRRNTRRALRKAMKWIYYHKPSEMVKIEDDLLNGVVNFVAATKRYNGVVQRWGDKLDRFMKRHRVPERVSRNLLRDLRGRFRSPYNPSTVNIIVDVLEFPEVLLDMQILDYERGRGKIRQYLRMGYRKLWRRASRMSKRSFKNAVKDQFKFNPWNPRGEMRRFKKLPRLIRRLRRTKFRSIRDVEDVTDLVLDLKKMSDRFASKLGKLYCCYRSGFAVPYLTLEQYVRTWIPEIRKAYYLMDGFPLFSERDCWNLRRCSGRRYRKVKKLAKAITRAKMENLYTTTHLIYTFSEYGIFKLFWNHFKAERDHLLDNIRYMKEVAKDRDLPGEMADALQLINVSNRNRRLRDLKKWELNQQRRAGYWNEFRTKSFSRAFHPTHTGITSLLDHRYARTVSSYPRRLMSFDRYLRNFRRLGFMRDRHKYFVHTKFYRRYRRKLRN